MQGPVRRLWCWSSTQRNRDTWLCHAAQGSAGYHTLLPRPDRSTDRLRLVQWDPGSGSRYSLVSPLPPNTGALGMWEDTVLTALSSVPVMSQHRTSCCNIKQLTSILDTLLLQYAYTVTNSSNLLLLLFSQIML